jgi:hypothetical protein
VTVTPGVSAGVSVVIQPQGVSPLVREPDSLPVQEGIGEETCRARMVERDRAIVETVGRFHQMTGKQLERLFFVSGYVRQGRQVIHQPSREDTRAARARRVLARLVEQGRIRRLPRPIVGTPEIGGGYVYVSRNSKTRREDDHKLCIGELYVRLVELAYPMQFKPHYEARLSRKIEPDAHVRIYWADGKARQWYVEMDNTSEWNNELSGKLRRYRQAYDDPDGPTFPQILFIMRERSRYEAMLGLVDENQVFDDDGTPLFRVELYEDAGRVIAGL